MSTPEDEPKPRVRPPDPRGAGNPAASIKGLLSNIASPIRVAVLAALSAQPRTAEEIGHLLNLTTPEVQDHLVKLSESGLVSGRPLVGQCALTTRVSTRRRQDELLLHLTAEDGAVVTARLPLHTPTGRLLIRGLGGLPLSPDDAAPKGK